jgi:hypothetical protein
MTDVGDFAVQAMFFLFVVGVFLIPAKYFPNVNKSGDMSMGKALVAFAVCSVAQLFVVWLGNMSDVAAVTFLSHALAGAIFGGGMRMASQFLKE